MSQLRSRRDVLKMSVLVAGAVVPTGCYRDGVDPGVLSAEASAAYFPQSVASGDPRPDSVVLWVRVEDLHRKHEDLVVSLVMATDPELTERVELTGELL